MVKNDDAFRRSIEQQEKENSHPIDYFRRSDAKRLQKEFFKNSYLNKESANAVVQGLPLDLAAGKRVELNWFERKALFGWFGKEAEKSVRESLGFSE